MKAADLSDPTDRRSRRGTVPLDRERIVQAAVALLDELGLAGLSTRRLADALGVRSATLYWHVRDKDELLDLVAEALCADAFTIDDAQPWREQLASGLRQFRALLLRHRDAAALLRQRRPTGPNRLGHLETTARILLTAGFTEDDAAGIAQLLAAHVLASVRDEPAADRPAPDAPALDGLPYLRRLAPAVARLDQQRAFQLHCEIILDGLSHRLHSYPDRSQRTGSAQT